MIPMWERRFKLPGEEQMRRRVLIFRPGLSDEEIAQLKKLLTDSGCPEPELADSIGEYVEPAKAETVIF